MHLVVTPDGIPVSFDLLPASCHDLTPIHELMERLPTGTWVYADKGDNSGEDEAWIEGETGIRLVPRRREKMEPNTLAETFGLARYRGRVETVNSQVEAWGMQRLHARTHEGWVIKVLASVFTLLCLNADEQSRYYLPDGAGTRGIQTSRYTHCPLDPRPGSDASARTCGGRATARTASVTVTRRRRTC